MTEKIHYVARITITRVSSQTETTSHYGSGSGATASSASTRKTAELASITVKNNDLDTLKSKIASHIALVDEADVTEDDTKVMR